MNINNMLIEHLQQTLSSVLDVKLKNLRLNKIGDGSINEVYVLQISTSQFIIKLNDRYTYPNLFKLEAAGLMALAETNTIAIPEIITHGEFDVYTFLILERIEAGSNTSAASALLGRQIAALHSNGDLAFGFKHDNYMGSLPQSNTRHNSWADFFVQERLRPMVRIAIDKGLLSVADIADTEKLFQQLPQLFDEEAPALLHGDLWSGNFLISTKGKPYLIDPAVSYGHREFDIAMTTLFDGFTKDFYQAYHETFPLAPGWQQRTELWNLYPLLFHLNLFGRSYLSRVKAAIKSYV